MIIQSKHRVEAKIGQGGPEISLVTTNGSIKITKYGFPKIRGTDDAQTSGDTLSPARPRRSSGRSRGGRVDLRRFQWEPKDGAAGQSPAARKFLRELTKPQ
jgi:hypothetical protein